MTMRTMSKSATAVRYGRDSSRPAARSVAAGSAGAGSAAARPGYSLAERVKTFLDRTLDAARGRYDL
jgi:hypothetical protein